MAATPTQRDPITFTDWHTESGIVIRLFLDAIYTGTVEGVGDPVCSASLMELTQFAKKWECPEVLAMVKQEIRLNLGREGQDQLNSFFLAVGMTDYELAAACLRYRPATEWESEDNHPKEAVHSFHDIGPLPCSVLDISAMPYQTFCQVDPEIAWALLRSANIAKLIQNGKHFEDNYGDEFLKLMRIQYPLEVDGAPSVLKKRSWDEI